MPPTLPAHPGNGLLGPDGLSKRGVNNLVPVVNGSM
jgi:hypothetical protein